MDVNKIKLQATEPADKNSLWLKQEAGGKMNLSAFGSQGWSSVGNSENANWSETDPSSPAYIKNKPEVYTKSETDTLLGAKQGTLVSGENIKTVNNESILGSSNIQIGGGGNDVIYAECEEFSDIAQFLTDNESYKGKDINYVITTPIWIMTAGGEVATILRCSFAELSADGSECDASFTNYVSGAGAIAVSFNINLETGAVISA